MFVSRATAEIARKRFPNFGVGQRCRIHQNFMGRCQHAGCAEAALQGVMLAEFLLEQAERANLAHAFNSRYVPAIGLHSQA